MKKQMMALTAALLLAFSLTACGGRNNDGNNAGSGDGTVGAPDASDNTATGDNSFDRDETDSVRKEDCASVYAEVISINGDKLSVRAGDRVLSLTTDHTLLNDWKAGDEVVLFYTGEFGDQMQVRYIDKWTENSEVQRDEDENAQENASGQEDGGVLE